MAHIGNGGDTVSSSSGAAPKMQPKIPKSVRSIMVTSKQRIYSLRMRKAMTMTMMGERLLTTDMIVSGIYFVTE